MALLDDVFSREPAVMAGTSVDHVASTQAVQALIERHVGPGDALLLFTAASVKLEQRLLAKLQAERSKVHAHVNDELSQRAEREHAKVGDVTVTLIWNDSTDLDLHVFTPTAWRSSTATARRAAATSTST